MVATFFILIFTLLCSSCLTNESQLSVHDSVYHLVVPELVKKHYVLPMTKKLRAQLPRITTRAVTMGFEKIPQELPVSATDYLLYLQNAKVLEPFRRPATELRLRLFTEAEDVLDMLEDTLVADFQYRVGELLDNIPDFDEKSKVQELFNQHLPEFMHELTPFLFDTVPFFYLDVLAERVKTALLEIFDGAWHLWVRKSIRTAMAAELNKGIQSVWVNVITDKAALQDFLVDLQLVLSSK